MDSSKFKYFTFFLIGLFLLFGQIGEAQIVGTPYMTAGKVPPCLDKNTSGTDFLFTYGEAYGDLVNSFELQIITKESNNISITLPTNQTYNFTMSANSIKQINFGTYEGAGNADVRNSIYLNAETGIINNKTIRVTSTSPISLYQYNGASGSVATSLVVPTALWGTEYYNVSYKSNNKANTLNPANTSEIIIANENNTIITLPDNTTRILNMGDLFVTASDRTDYTGRHIISSKPVGYIANLTIINIPEDQDAGDSAFEWMMPTSHWGKFFLIPNIRLNASQPGTRIRVFAAEDATKITYFSAAAVVVAGSTVINAGNTLDKGQWVELEMNSANENTNCYIYTDKPVAVVSYIKGSGGANLLGDPAMMWASTLDQAVGRVSVAPFIRSSNDALTHKMLIITKTSDKTFTTLNGTALTSGWSDLGGSGSSVYRYTFTNSTDFGKVFNVENLSAGVTVLIYGYSDITAYSYNAGSGGCTIFN